MKIIELKLNLSSNQNVLHRKFIYIAENDSSEIIGYCHTPQEGTKDFVLYSLEPGIYYFNFQFNHRGKYVFVFSEDGIKKLIMITTIT